MVAEVVPTQESEIGDGTTSAVMIAGKLLENAENFRFENSSDRYYQGL